MLELVLISRFMLEFLFSPEFVVAMLNKTTQIVPDEVVVPSLLYGTRFCRVRQTVSVMSISVTPNIVTLQSHCTVLCMSFAHFTFEGF